MYVKFTTPQNEVIAINGNQIRYISEQTPNRCRVFFEDEHHMQINCGLDDAIARLNEKPVSSRARK